ncbi:unnamed protein product [Adineta ricciae]|uniref:F-box domain-containing protein n=1 Tax=Adineta ricciae TaxID=249248 RepID=A0A814HER7_ADIRI|nr:unnamed protein product [Adineta ricciae]CAF1009826.1 unnamed protein product [Adineta ricciae]
MTMKFEFLPNEILIFCFEYFNIFELFSSFDRLNLRFSKLIRHVPLQLNLQNISKQLFDQFCIHLSSNPEIQQQIYSLHLSNRHSSGQIQHFLTRFTLKDFSHLQFLSLVDVQRRQISRITSSLPSLSSLRIRHIDNDYELMEHLPMDRLQRLSILSLHSVRKRLPDTFNIRKLTILACLVDDLINHLFDYFPQLESFHVQFVSPYNYPLEREIPAAKSQGVHLKHLTIDLFKYDFEQFELFAKQIPNLRSLSIKSRGNSMINARRWEDLIQTSLKQLKVFKFQFTCDHHQIHHLERFQSEFWWKEHQWHTEYSRDKHFALVYTVPYPSTIFKLDLQSQRFPGRNLAHVFDRVTNVTLSHELIHKRCDYYFPTIETLEVLIDGWDVLIPVRIEDLKTIINLNSLTHVNVSNYERSSTCYLLLSIFPHAPNFIWITMNPEYFSSVAENTKLCQYFYQRIRKVDMIKYDHSSFEDYEEMTRFCEIFANIEQLVCHVREVNGVFILLDRLRKLSTAEICFPAQTYPDSSSAVFKEQEDKYNYFFHIESISRIIAKVSMWIGERVK